jgi:hypothetical protein
LVAPDVIVVAHTATSYYLGRKGEADLLMRLEKSTGKRVITAFWVGAAGARVARCAPIGARHALVGGDDIARQGAFGKRTAWRSSISPISARPKACSRTISPLYAIAMAQPG